MFQLVVMVVSSILAPSLLFFCILIYNPACITTILFQVTSILSLQKELCYAMKIKIRRLRSVLAGSLNVRAARRPSNRLGGSPAVCPGCSPGGHSSGLLAGRSSRQCGSHEHQKASVCLPVDRPGNVGSCKWCA